MTGYEILRQSGTALLFYGSALAPAPRIAELLHVAMIHVKDIEYADPYVLVQASGVLLGALPDGAAQRVVAKHPRPAKFSKLHIWYEDAWVEVGLVDSYRRSIEEHISIDTVGMPMQGNKSMLHEFDVWVLKDSPPLNVDLAHVTEYYPQGD